MKLDQEIIRRTCEWTDGSGYTSHVDTLTGETRIATHFSGTYTIEEVRAILGEMEAVRTFVASGAYAEALRVASAERAFAEKLHNAEMAIARAQDALGADLAGRSVTDLLADQFPDWSVDECANIAAQIGA